MTFLYSDYTVAQKADIGCVSQKGAVYLTRRWGTV